MPTSMRPSQNKKEEKHECPERSRGTAFQVGVYKVWQFHPKVGCHLSDLSGSAQLVSGPIALKKVAYELSRISNKLAFNRIAGVPLAGLPIATALSLRTMAPMIYPRQAKEHGTKQTIEGIYKSGETVLLIDDLITRGGSKLEAIAVLEGAGLKVQDVLVLIDREQGGAADLASRGYKLHSVMTLKQVLGILRAAQLISEQQYAEVMTYLEAR